MTTERSYKTSTLERSYVTSGSSNNNSSGVGGGGTTTNSFSIGITPQPYRSYLTDRNHFFHSASHPANNLQVTPSSVTSTTITTSKLPQVSVTNNSLNQKSESKQSINSISQQHAAMLKSKRPNSGGGGSSTVGNSDYKSSLENGIDDEDEYDLYQPSACSRCCYGILWLLAQFGLWGAVLILLYWFFKFDKGFAYQNDKRKMFNLHAFLMLTGFIFVNGQCKFRCFLLLTSSSLMLCV